MIAEFTRRAVTVSSIHTRAQAEGQCYLVLKNLLKKPLSTESFFLKLKSQLKLPGCEEGYV
jgi:hypothetical protein